MNMPNQLSNLDCRGQQCPAPILAIAQAVRSHGTGPLVLEVLADDADFPTDVEAWCRATGANVLEHNESEGAFRFVLGVNGVTQLPSAAPAPTAAPTAAPTTTALDLCGLSSNAALLRLSIAVSRADASLQVRSDAPGFASSVYGWAATVGAEIQDLRVEAGVSTLSVQLTPSVASEIDWGNTPTDPGIASQQRSVSSDDAQLPAVVQSAALEPVTSNRATLLVLHNDFEKLMAAMMVANAAAAQGMDVQMYFSFWGVHLLRADRPDRGGERPGWIQRMMAWMTPAGPQRQPLGKMHFGGVGLGLMNRLMRNSNILGLEQLMDAAEEQGVTFVACTMSMGLMGVRKCDLTPRDNLSFGGVTAFVEAARDSRMSMVF